MPPTTGVLEAIDADRTMLTTGGDGLDLIVFHLLTLDVDFVVHEPRRAAAHIDAGPGPRSRGRSLTVSPPGVSPSSECFVRGGPARHTPIRPGVAA